MTQRGSKASTNSVEVATLQRDPSSLAIASKIRQQGWCGCPGKHGKWLRTCLSLPCSSHLPQNTTCGLRARKNERRTVMLGSLTHGARQSPRVQWPDRTEKRPVADFSRAWPYTALCQCRWGNWGSGTWSTVTHFRITWEGQLVGRPGRDFEVGTTKVCPECGLYHFHVLGSRLNEKERLR